MTKQIPIISDKRRLAETIAKQKEFDNTLKKMIESKTDKSQEECVIADCEYKNKNDNKNK